MSLPTNPYGTALKQQARNATPETAVAGSASRSQRRFSASVVVTDGPWKADPENISFWPTRTEIMSAFSEIKKIFSAEDMKKSKKREALKKSLVKLESKGETIREALKAESSGKKRKELETKLETNLRHQKKARDLIKELG